MQKIVKKTTYAPPLVRIRNETDRTALTDGLLRTEQSREKYIQRILTGRTRNSSARMAFYETLIAAYKTRITELSV